MNFAERYGAWAVIAGASEGTGAAFAEKVAARGVNCILIARRAEPLEAVAREISSKHNIACVTAAIDLSKPDAFKRIAAAVGDREVGLYISNAGADPNGSHFLDRDVGAWTDLINRNILTSVRCCHHFGGLMRRRGRGGILLVGSGACYGGGPHLAAYAGAKAFDLCFAEGLWAELGPHGVHVLNLVMTTTDTPALRALLAEKGVPLPPGVASAGEVAEMGLARLPHGPVHNWGLSDDAPGYAQQGGAAQRRARVLMTAEASKSVFGDGKRGAAQ